MGTTQNSDLKSVGRWTRIFIFLATIWKYYISRPLWLLKSRYRIALYKYISDKNTEQKVEETRQFIKENPHIMWKNDRLNVKAPIIEDKKVNFYGEENIIHRPLS